MDIVEIKNLFVPLMLGAMFLILGLRLLLNDEYFSEDINRFKKEWFRFTFKIKMPNNEEGKLDRNQKEVLRNRRYLSFFGSVFVFIGALVLIRIIVQILKSKL